MSDGKKKKMVVKFFRAGRYYKERICRRFGWNITSETVNGHSIVEVKEEDMPDLDKTVKGGFIGIIKWL